MECSRLRQKQRKPVSMGKRANSQTKTPRKRNLTRHRLRRRKNHGRTRTVPTKGRAVGVDSSEKMINLAKTTFPQKDYPNLSFQVMDARKLTFQAEFDRAFSNAALHWIVDQKAVLYGVQRSLKSGGRLLFQMAGKGNAKDVLSIIKELAAVKPWKGFFSNMTFPYGFYDPKEYRAFLQAGGFGG